MKIILTHQYYFSRREGLHSVHVCKKKFDFVGLYSSKSNGNVTTLPTHTSYKHCHDIYQELMSGEAANKFLIAIYKSKSITFTGPLEASRGR